MTQPTYPQTDSHLWGEFPVLAIETGGYNDLTAVDPYTGNTVRIDLTGQDATVYDSLRRLIDRLEAEHTLDAPT